MKYNQILKYKDCNKPCIKHYLSLKNNPLTLEFNIISSNQMDTTYIFNIILIQLISLQTPKIVFFKKSYQKYMFITKVCLNRKELIENWELLWSLLLKKTNYKKNKTEIVLKDLSKLPTNVYKLLNYKNNLIYKRKR